MRKINFKQPKYILPAVIFIPVVCLIYFVCNIFGSDNKEETGLSDSFNTSFPEAESQGAKSKLSELDSRFEIDDRENPIEGLDAENNGKDSLRYGNDKAMEEMIIERERVRLQSEELQRRMRESNNRMNSGGYNNYSRDDYASDLEQIRQRSEQRQRDINRALGIPDEDEEALKMTQPQEETERKERERYEMIERNRPNLVLVSNDANADKFNTLSSGKDQIQSSLIQAMIDQTTKATDGTRIRFKLLNDVTVKDVSLPKGTYLYGVVSGFSEQRVKATISSVFVNGRFIKVDLAVYDNDGMEGFYVPASSFREFVKDATSRMASSSNININSGYGSEISGEAIALQALQNLYQSASSAVSSNVRRNKARLKYNTVVYLINSDQAK